MIEKLQLIPHPWFCCAVKSRIVYLYGVWVEVTPSAPSCFKNDLRLRVVQPAKRRRQAEIHLASSSDVCRPVYQKSCYINCLLHTTVKWWLQTTAFRIEKIRQRLNSSSLYKKSIVNNNHIQRFLDVVFHNILSSYMTISDLLGFLRTR